jgi:hypothetical protein
MKKFVKKYGLITAGMAAGAMAGYFYWKFAGCGSGSCTITARPLNSSIYGAVMGGLLFSLFKNNKKETV